MIFETSVIRDKLKGLDPGLLLRTQILSHAFLIITGNTVVQIYQNGLL